MNPPEPVEVSPKTSPTIRQRLVVACFILGLTGVFLSAFSSWQLASAHLRGLSLAGCGPDAGCTELTEGRWGNIAGWPVSYIGLTWFTGLAIVWLETLRGSNPVIRWLIRASLAGSVLFLVLMFSLGHFCEFCLKVHAGNLLLFLASECSAYLRPGPANIRHGRGPLVSLAASMVFLSAILAVWESRVAEQRQSAAANSSSNVVREIVSTKANSNGSTGNGVLTGRWRQGPERSPVRIVVFGDYQCKDCRLLDLEIEALRKSHPQISVTFRHFPMCRDCNVAIRHPRFHDNACVAAHAAEAAGELLQAEGFWRMHQWLFSKEGAFTDAELRAALPELGFADSAKFLKAMSLPTAQNAVTDDVQLAISLGLDSTPLVFINGVELPDADVAGTLTRTATELIRQGVPEADSSGDSPRSSVDRLVTRWRNEPEVQFPESLAGWTEGRSDAPVKITLVFDYANPYTPLLDQVASEIVRQHPNVQLTRILFPLSKSLNPRFAKWEQDYYGASTEMARFSQACAESGDPVAWQKMHVWLLEHQSDFDLPQAVVAAKDAGLDDTKLEAAGCSDAVTVALQQRLQGVESLGIKWASTLYINGRRVTAIAPTVELLERIVSEAASPAVESGR